MGEGQLSPRRSKEQQARSRVRDDLLDGVRPAYVVHALEGLLPHRKRTQDGLDDLWRVPRRLRVLSNPNPST